MVGKFKAFFWALLMAVLWMPRLLLRHAVSWKWTPKCIYWPVAAWVVLRWTMEYWGATSWFEIVLYHCGALPFVAMAFDAWEELHQSAPAWKPVAQPGVLSQPRIKPPLLLTRAWLPKALLIPLAGMQCFTWLFIEGGMSSWLGLALLLAMIVEVMVEAFQQERLQK